MPFNQVPQYVFDHMPYMREAELKVVMCVARKTLGWNKEWDKIGRRQFEEDTGLSNYAVIEGVEDAVARGIIERQQKGNSFEYRLLEPTMQPQKVRTEGRYPNQFGVDTTPESGGETTPNNGVDTTPIESRQQKQNGVDTTPKNGVDSTHTTYKTNNKTLSNDKVEAPSGASPPSADDEPEQDGWFAAMCWLRYGHQDYKLLNKMDRLAIGKSIKKIRKSDKNYTIDDLRSWYKNIWSQEWPGKQPGKAEVQHPTLNQIETGIGRVKQVKPTDMVSPNGNQPSYMRLKQL